jgi:RNA polymerase sigma factor (sigma-70 family)
MTIDRNDFPEVTEVRQSRWLLNYTNNRIHILKLSSYLSGDDVIQYAALCLTKELQSGKEITYPIAWAKLVCERHINKQYKKNKNIQAQESNQIERLANLRSQEIDIHFFDNNEQLHHSIQQLRPSSKQIIEMRFFQQLHWEQIATILSRQEERQICAATARKRGERAINELRQIYRVN